MISITGCLANLSLSLSLSLSLCGIMYETFVSRRSWPHIFHYSYCGAITALDSCRAWPSWSRHARLERVYWWILHCGRYGEAGGQSRSWNKSNHKSDISVTEIDHMSVCCTAPIGKRQPTEKSSDEAAIAHICFEKCDTKFNSLERRETRMHCLCNTGQRSVTVTIVGYTGL